jgi:hypothetical protein
MGHDDQEVAVDMMPATTASAGASRREVSVPTTGSPAAGLDAKVHKTHTPALVRRQASQRAVNT